MTESPRNGHGEEALRSCFLRDRALEKRIREGLLSLALGRAVQIGRPGGVQGRALRTSIRSRETCAGHILFTHP